MFKTIFKRTFQGVLITGSIYMFCLQGQQRQNINGIYKSVVNSLRTAYILRQSIQDYRISLSGLTYNTEEYHKVRSEVHMRVANRILQLSKQNKGIYLKLGQYLGNLDKVVPWEFTHVLKVLQDSAPSINYQEIKVVIETDLKQNIKQIFKQFDKQAIAAASLAQVHRAVLHNDKQVAVKLQYPFLQIQSKWDLLVLGKITQFCSYLLKRNKNTEIDLIKLFDTWTSTLVQQLDFTIEVDNALKCRQMFKNNDKIYIPEYYRNLSSQRMIVMEFIKGTKINQREQLQKQGINPKKVAKNLTDIFTTMIFQHGFVHCDAHPGNIFVRKKSNSVGHQIVLLDHGLYRTIRKKTIQNFSGLWLSLMMSDKQKVESYAKQLNIEKHLEYLPIIFLLRTRNSKKKIGQSFTKEQRQQFRQKDLSNFDSINQILNDLPPELMFIIRASNLVASHNLSLGGTTRERLFEYAKHSIRAIYPNRASYYFNYLTILLRIWMFENLFFLYKLMFKTLDQ